MLTSDIERSMLDVPYVDIYIGRIGNMEYNGGGGRNDVA